MSILKVSKEKIIKIGQWLIIILLAIACFYFWRESKINNENLIGEVQFQKNDKQYVVIANDKTVSELKKTNEELYDSIKKLSNVSEAVQIKYVTKYSTDTMYFEKTYVPKDSIYHYAQESDTVNYDLRIKAQDVDWFKLDFAIKDSLMLVTRTKNGQSETTISHGDNTTVTSATVYIPKKTTAQKIKDKMYFGVGIGVGYGVINKKADIYVGVSAGIRF